MQCQPPTIMFFRARGKDPLTNDSCCEITAFQSVLLNVCFNGFQGGSMLQKKVAGAGKPVTIMVILAWLFSLAALFGCVWLTRG